MAKAQEGDCYSIRCTLVLFLISLFVIIMLFDSLSMVSAQSVTTTSNFITYTDPTHGFTIKRPSDSQS
jgi:hypothetical protein